MRSVIPVCSDKFWAEIRVGTLNGDLGMFRLGKETARVEEEQDDYDIGDQKNKERADDDAYELPEVVSGGFNSKRQANADENEYQENLNNAK